MNLELGYLSQKVYNFIICTCDTVIYALQKRLVNIHYTVAENVHTFELFHTFTKSFEVKLLY